MMKIALINPRNIDTPAHPLGLLYIAAVLEREGYLVKVFDQAMDTPAEATATAVADWKPSIIGITATTPQFGLGIRIARSLKRCMPEIGIVFGGPHPTVCPHEVLSHPDIDYVVIGEGEITMLELCKHIESGSHVDAVKGIGYKKDGKIVLSDPRPLIENIDSLPFPARHLMSERWYFAPPRIRGVWTKSLISVMASRGCPYQCIWCSSHTIFGKKVRLRSPENIVAEIREAKERYGIDSVYFYDDTFTVSHKWVERICGLFKENGLDGLKWACQARVNTVNPDILRIMKAAGCVQLDFGIESGSERVLKILHKETDLDQMHQAFRNAKKVGIQAFASIIVGTPGETREDVRLTAKLLHELKPDYTEIFYATPYPGTELYRMASEMRVIDTSIPYENWYVSKQVDRPVMVAGGSEQELIGFRTVLENQLFWRNYRTLFSNPGFVAGALRIAIIGLPGLWKGCRRFLATRKLDSISVEILREYRRRIK